MQPAPPIGPKYYSPSWLHASLTMDCLPCSGCRAMMAARSSRTALPGKGQIMVLSTTPMFVYAVRERAEQLGLDQSKLSRRADVSRDAVRRYWTNAVHHPDLRLLAKLAAVLRCRVHDLIAVAEDASVQPLQERPAPAPASLNSADPRLSPAADGAASPSS